MYKVGCGVYNIVEYKNMVRVTIPPLCVLPRMVVVGGTLGGGRLRYFIHTGCLDHFWFGRFWMV